MTPTVLAIAGSGWMVALLLVGLWLGERGRRIDAQRREDVLPIARRVARAQVTPAPTTGDKRLDALRSSAVPAEVEAMTDARDRYVADAVREGYKPEDAGADFDLMLAAAFTDQAGQAPD